MDRWNKEHRYDIICFFWLWAKIRIHHANPFRQFFFGKLLGCREGHIQHDGVKIPCARCPSRALWTACLHVLVDFFFKVECVHHPLSHKTPAEASKIKNLYIARGRRKGIPPWQEERRARGCPWRMRCRVALGSGAGDGCSCQNHWWRYDV